MACRQKNMHYHSREVLGIGVHCTSTVHTNASSSTLPQCSIRLRAYLLCSVRFRFHRVAEYLMPRKKKIHTLTRDALHTNKLKENSKRQSRRHTMFVYRMWAYPGVCGCGYKCQTIVFVRNISPDHWMERRYFPRKWNVILIHFYRHFYHSILNCVFFFSHLPTT